MAAIEYDLELEKAKKAIKETNAKKVLIQLPEGLKPKAAEIADKLKQKDVEVFIWCGTCFGACDLPNVTNFDLLIQFGHSEFSA